MNRNTLGPRFDNRYVRELPGDAEEGARIRQVHGALFSRVMPTPVAAPRVVAVADEVAAMLELDAAFVASDEFAQTFGGNALLDGMEPYAANYGGHQFGHWAGQLGDGRAITLGELVTSRGERYDLQLKGAGQTPYSRHADGRAVLRSSIREFLCSEAMHHLGVPTTRALSLVATGELVVRDMFYDGNARPEPGAIVCRVAPSFTRFGNFELPASRGERDLLEKLVEFTIDRDFPHLKTRHADASEQREAFFVEVCERTARTIAEWMRVGFVHGVMNTDNLSILGLTIDYGPYGWIDNYDPDWTPNTTDAQGRRYAFGRQPHIAHWNLSRLAGALSPLFESADPLQRGLDRYVAVFNDTHRENYARKLGLERCTEDDVDLIGALQGVLVEGEIDMTLFFRALADVDLAAPSVSTFDAAFYDATKRAAVEPALQAWLARYAARARAAGLAPAVRRTRMHAANPKFVLRNYLAQEAIDRAERGDDAGITELLDVMRRPYDEQPGREKFAAKRPDWARSRAGCSMLSCSS